MSKRCKCFDLSFFFVDFIWISLDEHDSRFQESSLRQCQIPDAVKKERVVGRKQEVRERSVQVGEGGGGLQPFTTRKARVGVVPTLQYLLPQIPSAGSLVPPVPSANPRQVVVGDHTKPALEPTVQPRVRPRSRLHREGDSDLHLHPVSVCIRTLGPLGSPPYLFITRSVECSLLQTAFCGHQAYLATTGGDKETPLITYISSQIGTSVTKVSLDCQLVKGGGLRQVAGRRSDKEDVRSARITAMMMMTEGGADTGAPRDSVDPLTGPKAKQRFFTPEKYYISAPLDNGKGERGKGCSERRSAATLYLGHQEQEMSLRHRWKSRSSFPAPFHPREILGQFVSSNPPPPNIA
ncbi:hypothetical protein J6590_063675 [Homalodisca vitripennis]|nr:hypothetical protein J6590_063675 [Homalodisca vitripennis]